MFVPVIVICGPSGLPPGCTGIWVGFGFGSTAERVALFDWPSECRAGTVNGMLGPPASLLRTCGPWSHASVE